jgi:hypothetical protein
MRTLPAKPLFRSPFLEAPFLKKAAPKISLKHPRWEKAVPKKILKIPFKKKMHQKLY